MQGDFQMSDINVPQKSKLDTWYPTSVISIYHHHQYQLLHYFYHVLLCDPSPFHMLCEFLETVKWMHLQPYPDGLKLQAF